MYETRDIINYCYSFMPYLFIEYNTGHVQFKCTLTKKTRAFF